LKILEPSEELT